MKTQHYQQELQHRLPRNMENVCVCDMMSYIWTFMNNIWNGKKSPLLRQCGVESIKKEVGNTKAG
jgi:hypothetical protein